MPSACALPIKFKQVVIVNDSLSPLGAFAREHICIAATRPFNPFVPSSMTPQKYNACHQSPHKLRNTKVGGPSIQPRNMHYVAAKTVHYWHEDTACIPSRPPRGSLMTRAGR
ncbi:hypothetical protein C8Q76DRAFT_198833 [Earliella scabrosa]|nr:hypothetical protein C8Q76DRAFT_198833 [Earliella scabrosa]